MKQQRRFLSPTSLFGVLFVALGLSIVAACLVFPASTEKYIGRAKVAIDSSLAEARGQEYITVTIGAKGGKALLDACDGTFPRIIAYELSGAPPTYAAHNNCKGDVILPAEVGDLIAITNLGMYQVRDLRVVPKLWSTTDDLLGLEGELLLQTCYYGENRMKFLALVPVQDDPYDDFASGPRQVRQ